MSAPTPTGLTRADILDVLALEPCHITGTHTPNHHLESLCTYQKAAMLDRLLAFLDTNVDELPRRLHEDCYWCHNIPTQELYREHLRATYRWAGVEISDELAAPAPDVPRPGDADAVHAALTGEFAPWQDVLPKVNAPDTGHMPHTRYWAAVEALGDRVEQRDIAVRRSHGTPT